METQLQTALCCVLECQQQLLHLEILAIKGQRAADQSVEDHTQTPHVNLRTVVLLPLNKHTHTHRVLKRLEAASLWLHLE